MGSIRHMQTGFIAGETSPLMNGRIETSHHAYGLAICENFVPYNEGPIVKRPGFQYICDADPSSTWLSAFRFNVTQEYMLEWGEQKLRFFTNGGRIEPTPGTPLEVATPYVAADASMLSMQQDFDRLYIAHPTYPPAALSRTGATAFSHAPLVLANGPLADENADDTVTVTVSAVSGTADVMSSSPIFAAGMVGGLMRIDANDFSTVKVWEPGMDGVTVGMIVRSDGKAYTALTSGTTGTSTPIHERGAEWDGQLGHDVNGKGPYGVKWQFRSLHYGTIAITGFTSDTQVTGTVGKQFPDSLTSVASSYWRLPLFSAAAGWPALVYRWLGRLGFVKDFDLLASVAGDLLNFEIETTSETLSADLSFRRRLDAENAPLWCIADRKLLLGTANKEFAVGPINANVSISGDNISADIQSYYGSEAIAPVQAGTQTLFIERGGRRIRAADYNYASDRYDAPDLTATAAHITRGGVLQLTTQRVPQTMIHAVRGDGQIVVHPLTRVDVKGLSRMVLGGGARALSAVSIVGQDGKTDELWLLVERTRADGVAREIWKQAKWRDLGDDPNEDFYVDCGVRIDAAAGQTRFSGFTFLAGQAVAVLAGGGVVAGVTIGSDGTFDLSSAGIPISGAYTAIVGLSYTATAQTRTPPASVQSGPIQGLKVRIRKLVLRLIETIGILVGQDPDTLEEPVDRSVYDLMDTPVPLFTGDTDGTSISAEIRPDGSCLFVSAVPKPAIITAAMLTLEVDGSDG